MAITVKAKAGRVAQTASGSRREAVRLWEIKDDLSRFLREAEGEKIVITRKPAGLLIGFAWEDD